MECSLDEKNGVRPHLLDPQDAIAPADAARAGTYRLDDGALVERLDEGVELAAIARELDGVSVLGDVDDAPAEDVRHALHVPALLLPGAHLDEHQLALDVPGFRDVDHLDDVDQLVQLL